jgi:succinoglycan biosynthesis protein ExoV
VLGEMAGCSLIVSEAMHGVIVADALRIPWIALTPLAAVHGPKWGDWGAAMDLDIAFQRLSPSSLGERLHLSRLAQRNGRFRKLIERNGKRLDAVAPDLFVERAARALRRAACATPQLTRDTALDRSRDRMRQTLRWLQANPRAKAAGSGRGG